MPRTLYPEVAPHHQLKEIGPKHPKQDHFKGSSFFHDRIHRPEADFKTPKLLPLSLNKSVSQVKRQHESTLSCKSTVEPIFSNPQITLHIGDAFGRGPFRGFCDEPRP